MSRPIVVPPELSSSPFLGAQAVQRGLLTPAQLRSKAYVRLMRGVYVVRERAVDDNVRLEALRLAIAPGTVVCGLTAAWLHGAWKPPPGRVVPLHVTRPVRAHGQQVAGVSRRRLVLRGSPDLASAELGYGMSVLDRDVVLLDGLAVTSTVRTCFDLMRQRWLVEAVAVADAFAYNCGMPLEHLGAYCADRRRWPYVREARVAASLAVTGARSPGESRLRMVVVLSGYPEPLVNVGISNWQGDHVATPDLLLWTSRWTALEYDGAWHDDDGQPERDSLRRVGIASDVGIPVLEFRANALRFSRPVIVDAIAKVSRRPPTQELQEQDFWRGTRS